MSESPAALRVREAMQSHGAGRLDEARAQYEAILADHPEDPDALHLLGVLHAQQHRHREAQALIERAVALRPHEGMFHNNLGNVTVEMGRLDDAEVHYRRAVACDPGRLDALNNLGVLQSRRGHADEAERLLRQVVELAPGFRDAYSNLAAHLLRHGRYHEAVQCCVDGLVTAPRSNPLRRLLGAAYGMLGMNDKAIELYRTWLAAEPGHPVALHHLQALTGEAADRASDGYVQQVFDSFASSFDAKLAGLGYRAPELVAAALAHGAPASPGWDVLDAGCGTGLCGPLLAPLARRLVGVDLSAGMLGRAHDRGPYHALYQGELVDYLGTTPGAWDAVVSADTLVYFGRLEAFGAAAFAALRPGGRLVFTLEAHAGDEPFRLQHHGRYSHARAYVEGVLAAAGFENLALRGEVLRQEAGQPVQGWVVSGRRPAAH